MQKIMLVGNIGKDPEERWTSNGIKVTSFSLAVNIGKPKDEAIWYQVRIWGEDMKNLVPHLKKGSRIMVFGDLMPVEVYADKQNNHLPRLQVNAKDITFVGGLPKKEEQLPSIFKKEETQDEELPF